MGQARCCNGSRISLDAGIALFIRAWNRLVDEYESYSLEWQRIIEAGDELQCYRAKELMRVVKEIGRIDSMPHELMLKTLDDIEVGMDGSMEVIFLAGIIVKRSACYL